MNQEKATSIHRERLKLLRGELARRKLDGFVVPRTDEHLGEDVGAYAERLAWLTGFRGSVGIALVLSQSAAIFVDGRYRIQVRREVDRRDWTFESLAGKGIAAWLCKQAPEGSRIAYDPWLHSKAWAAEVGRELGKKRSQLHALADNPLDALWRDRPAPPNARLIVHPDNFAGRSSLDKRLDVAAWLQSIDADAVILAALDSIAWVFNLRGRDAPRTPLASAYAFVNRDASADLVVAPDKLTQAVSEHLGTSVRVHPREAFEKHMASLAGRTIAVDPNRTVAALLQLLERNAVKVLEVADPVALPKATKNLTEVAGHKAAQLRDSVAVCRFLHWLSVEISLQDLTEVSAAKKLLEFREATGQLQGPSFETISAYGSNASVVHYHPSEETCRVLAPGSLYLVDSGGQYLDGTTDVTRTVAIGAPTAEMRSRFTQVLKGHIALARAVFPAGTRGSQLDAIARQHLWRIGVDYPHGTGHGVGSYLCVHEGPHRISKTPLARGLEDEALAPGMIVSNEPGYYKEGEYGIRIENLMLVVRVNIPAAEAEMLGFEMLSFAPIDRALIDMALLTAEELSWLDEYHANVERITGSQLDDVVAAWLQAVTQPLASSGPRCMQLKES